jgi:hypothetical protein
MNYNAWRRRKIALEFSCILLVAVFLCIPTVSAEEPLLIDLSVSGQPGDMPWIVSDIKPGFYGESVAVVTNTGTENGSLFIWAGNISGDYDFGKYLFFNISGPYLVRSIILPATIYDFPQSSEGSQFIIISPLEAGESITLHWAWEFIETFQPQNEAQGKSIQFIIYYTLKAPVVELDGWYDVDPPVYREVPIPGEPCDKMNQSLQEYRDYTCIQQYCTYVVTDYRWIDRWRVDYDEDDDGVCDGDDYCNGTVEWYAMIRLLPNHYDSSNMNLTWTHGCSCYQILCHKPGNNDGEFKFGCTYGTLNVWYNHTPKSWVWYCSGKPDGAFKLLFDDLPLKNTSAPFEGLDLPVVRKFIKRK